MKIFRHKQSVLPQLKRGWIFITSILVISFFVGLLINLQVSIGATNINADTSEHWAWNDLIGWIDFYNTDTITLQSSGLSGYASSSAGDISLDCATTRNGNICGQSDYEVTNNGLGDLSGWAWNDTYGWISFDCNNNSGCGESNYRVLINPDNGTFSNYAWNDLIGWISFNCSDPGICGSSNYKVKSSWTATSTSGTVDSTTFDTGVVGGAQINSFIWRGDLPASTAVRFQFASSNSSSGPWTYIGSDGTTETYYTTSPDASKRVSYTLHNNHRYFRYRIILVSNQAQTASPRVDEVVVNWSP